MTKSEYMAFHKAACEKMHTITKAKNADYTGTGANPFANFERVEALGICSTEQGFLTRMTDKMSRLSSFVQRGVLEVKDESVEDTLLDLANYSILLAAYIKAKKSPTHVTVGPLSVEDVQAIEAAIAKQPGSVTAALAEHSSRRHADWIAR